MPVGNRGAFNINPDPRSDYTRTELPPPSATQYDSLMAGQPEAPPAEAQLDPSQAGRPDSSNASP